MFGYSGCPVCTGSRAALMTGRQYSSSAATRECLCNPCIRSRDHQRNLADNSQYSQMRFEVGFSVKRGAQHATGASSFTKELALSTDRPPIAFISTPPVARSTRRRHVYYVTRVSTRVHVALGFTGVDVASAWCFCSPISLLISVGRRLHVRTTGGVRFSARARPK